ncbi:MAG: acyltransferase [Labilithrix sp.]|nr:acyltransferase [Labilithrix sp.]
MSADGMSSMREAEPTNESASPGSGGASPYRGDRPSKWSDATSHRARTWIALAALAFYGLFVFRTSFTVGGTRYFVLFEDAMISMRYARHLADGHGLVWNIGEAPIEGFTNLLWVLWMSVAHKLGLAESKISLFIMLSGVAILLATGLVTSKIARKLTTAPWVPVCVLAATLFDYPLVFWTLRGMEVGALTLAVYTLLWLALENEERFSLPRTLAMGALTSMALLIRSDSVVPVGLISLYGFLTCSRRWLFAAVIGAFAGGAVGGQTLFRKAYFHESLPNTYFLKLYKISTLARVKRGAFVALEVLALHLAVPISIVLASLPGVRPSVAWVKEVCRDRSARRLVLLGAIFSAQVAYATYVGGDAWEWMLYANRYMCVGMPALILLVGVLMQRAIASSDRAPAPAIAPGGASTEEDEPAIFARRFAYGLAASGLLLVALNLLARKFPEEGIAATIVFSKTPFAAGGAMVLGGLLLRMKDARRGLVEALGALRRRLESQRTAARAALIVAALVWLPSHLLPLGRWAAQNAAQYADEARYTRLGLLIQASTAPDFRIAVAAAGATPYFAQRPTEDLLGKNDRHVAKLAPRGVFSPGHDKWDYGYSLGQREAQLVVEAVDVNDADEQYMKRLGFEELANGMRLREGAKVARRDLIGQEMEDGDSLAAALGALGKTLPTAVGVMDFVVLLAFGLVIAGATRKIARDGESYAELSPSPPAEPVELDDAQRAALAGADARAIPTLDGMRGIAVILVLVFHFAWTFPGDDPSAATSFADKVAVHLHAFMWSGWSGVDLFFVLSGYLITRGLVTDSKKALGTRMKMFWMRRVLRIFPLYYAVIVVGTIVTLAFGAQWVPGLPYWLYMQNYTLAFDHEVMRWTAHFWSLAIEEQFYFIWPIVALMVPRRRLIPLILVLVFGTVALRAGLTFKGQDIGLFQRWFADEPGGLEHGIAKLVYRTTFTRADGLLLGAFVAVTQREVRHPVAQVWRRLRLPIFVGTAVALFGLYVWATGLNDYDRRVIGIGYVTLALFFASGISLCADHAISERSRRLLSWGPLVSCGKVSYGMYIFHWPLVVLGVPYLMKWQEGQSTLTQMGISGAFIVFGLASIWGLASLSFKFFESPFLKLKGKFHD